MKVSIELSPEYSEPYAIIQADKITDNIPVSYTHLDVYKRQDNACLLIEKPSSQFLLFLFT